MVAAGVNLDSDADIKALHEPLEETNECTRPYRYWDVAEATPRSPDTTGQLFFSYIHKEHDAFSIPSRTFLDRKASPNPSLVPSAEFAMQDFMHKTMPPRFGCAPCIDECSADVACALSDAPVGVEQTSAVTLSGAQRIVLQLDNSVLGKPRLESLELPSVGSAGHALGNCKPCAFVHTKGCGNGVDCPFCHLCRPGEKKRRRKEKLETHRGLRSGLHNINSMW